MTQVGFEPRLQGSQSRRSDHRPQYGQNKC